MPLYDTENPLAALRRRATQLAAPGVQRAFASGGGVSASPPIGSGGTDVGTDGYTIVVFTLDVDRLNDDHAVLGDF
jgi:hypothetical protein